MKKGKEQSFLLDAKSKANKRVWPKATLISEEGPDRDRMRRAVKEIKNKEAYRLLAMFDGRYRVDCFLPSASNALRRMGFHRIF